MKTSELKPSDHFKVLHNDNCYKLLYSRTLGNHIRHMYLDSNQEVWFSNVSNEDEIDIELITKKEFLNSKNIYK